MSRLGLHGYLTGGYTQVKRRSPRQDPNLRTRLRSASVIDNGNPHLRVVGHVSVGSIDGW